MQAKNANNSAAAAAPAASGGNPIRRGSTQTVGSQLADFYFFMGGPWGELLAATSLAAEPTA